MNMSSSVTGASRPFSFMNCLKSPAVTPPSTNQGQQCSGVPKRKNMSGMSPVPDTIRSPSRKSERSRWQKQAGEPNGTKGGAIHLMLALLWSQTGLIDRTRGPPPSGSAYFLTTPDREIVSSHLGMNPNIPPSSKCSASLNSAALSLNMGGRSFLSC